jgi:hypothetical protein
LRAAKVIQNPTKNAKNPFLKNQYADLGAVIDVVKSALLDNDVFVMQSCREVDGRLDVTTTFVHGPTGALAEILVSVHLKELSPQGSMGAFTYGRRYGLLAAFNLAAEDDDGNTASGRDELATKTIEVNLPSKTAEAAVSGIAGILAKKGSK